VQSGKRAIPLKRSEVAQKCIGTKPAHGRALAAFSRWCALVLLLAFAGLSRAYGDTGVILNESLDTSVARITGSGHSAIYVSRICPASPVKLRLCAPGEQGSVISNYTTLGEDQPYEWNIVPLSVFLYGVEDPANRPLIGSQKIKHLLEERYRDNFLAEYCASESCRASSKAEWREMVGATISRSLYIFVVKTTEEQDLALIAELNSSENVNHFNGITRNCADFTRKVMDIYFPGAAKPDYINDFAMTSPKAIARSFDHYSLKHPDMELSVLHFAQVPGTIKRSSEARSGTEQLYRSKKLAVPMAIYAPYELGVAAGTYVLTGRFNPVKESEKYPTTKATELSHQIALAKAAGDEDLVKQLQAAERKERTRVAGTPDEWKVYRSQLDSLVTEAIREEALNDRGDLKRLFKRIEEKGALRIDDNGALWVAMPEAGPNSEAGLSASNILAPGTDSQLAYNVMLSRAAHTLSAPKHSRETMLDFRENWDILQDARSKSIPPAGRTTPVTSSANDARPIVNGNN
jgi:hypothetical protein